MEIIPFEQIVNMDISPEQCVRWVKEVFLNKYSYDLPPKISIKLKDNIFYNTMPSYLPSENSFGVKVVSRYPHRKPSLKGDVLLYDIQTGDLLAVIDAVWITAMRTGAVAALSIQQLQKKSARQYGFIGLGNTARATLLCLADTLKDKQIDIKLLSHKKQEIDFANRFKAFESLNFSVCETAEELISTSDVVISSVTAMDNLMAPDTCYKSGVLVVPIHTRGFQNCDLFFDQIFVDDIGHVKDFKHFPKFKKVDELSNVLLGNNQGRTSDNERILAYNIGISIHDIYFAHKIFEMIKCQNKKEYLLFDNKNKFWV